MSETLNYRFTKGYEDAQLVLAGRKKVITQSNLTNADAELILKIERLKHNIEPIPKTEKIPTHTVRDIKKAVSLSEDLDFLMDLLATEMAMPNPRKGVVAAIEKRMTQLNDKH